MNPAAWMILHASNLFRLCCTKQFSMLVSIHSYFVKNVQCWRGICNAYCLVLKFEPVFYSEAKLCCAKLVYINLY